MLPFIIIMMAPFIGFCGVSFVALAPIALAGVFAVALAKVTWGMYIEAFSAAYDWAKKSLPAGNTATSLTGASQSVVVLEGRLQPVHDQLVLDAEVVAEIDAEIEDAVRIAKDMPKTASEASARLAEANDLVQQMEETVAAVEADAKRRS
jgi:hypothetical protein